MKREVFRAYVEQVLVPTPRHGEIVIMDNLPAHRPANLRSAIEGTGANQLYLLLYSPDLNPIENAFAKLKAFLRKAAARSIDSLWTTIADALGTFTPAECANYFSAAGYESE